MYVKIIASQRWDVFETVYILWSVSWRTGYIVPSSTDRVYDANLIWGMQAFKSSYTVVNMLLAF